MSTANPLTKEQMDIKMAVMDKDVKEKASAEIEHTLTLKGPVTEITMEQMIKERHKKYKYVDISEIVMIFKSAISSTAQYRISN